MIMANDASDVVQPAEKTKTAKPKGARTKKGGRPKGARTKDRASVTKLITISECPCCSCRKEPKSKRLIREGEASGTALGRPYGYYRLYKAQCAGCGKAFHLREYDAI